MRPKSPRVWPGSGVTPDNHKNAMPSSLNAFPAKFLALIDAAGR